MEDLFERFCEARVPRVRDDPTSGEWHSRGPADGFTGRAEGDDSHASSFLLRAMPLRYLGKGMLPLRSAAIGLCFRDLASN